MNHSLDRSPPSPSPAPERFVARFIDFWQNPSPQRLPEMVHDDVVLFQPLAAPVRGIAAAQEHFDRLWRFLPDLRATVDRWHGGGDLVFIEFRLHTSAGGRLVEWPVVDRIILRDEKVIENMTYFDPLAVLPTIGRRPSLWWRWWSSGAARPWRTGHHIDHYRRQLP
jgi:ketosteroid isomerase-like protein